MIKKHNQQYIGHVAIFITNLIFGLNFIFAKNVGTEYLSAGAFTMVRITAAGALFWLMAPMFPQPRLTKNDYLRLFLGAALGMPINMYSFLEGISLTSPVDASIIVTLVPLMVLLLSAIFLGDKITFTKLAGILLGFAGAAMLIIYSANSSFGSTGNMKGNIMCMVCVLSYSLYMIVIKPLANKMHPLCLMRLLFLAAFIQSAPFFGKDLITVDWSVMPSQTLISIAYVAIAATFIAYLLVAVGLNKLNPTIVSLYNYLQPVVATTAAILLGQDSLNIIKILAAMLVFSGVYLVIRNKPKAMQQV